MPDDHDIAAESRSLTVRRTTADDLASVETFIGPFVDEGRLLPRTTDELEDLLPSGFVALLDGQLVGFAALEVYSNKLAELRSLAVSDACR